MLDKCYIRKLKDQIKEHSERLERRLNNIRDINMHSGSRWYKRLNEREMLFNSIEDLQCIVAAQDAIIQTLCNDRINEAKKAPKN